MFPIVINDGNNPMPESDIYYVIGKEGIFIKKKLGVMESLSPVSNISILQSVQATAKMHIEKIPSIMVAKVANFFTEVYKEHRAEAVVLLFYNEETKKYKIVPPAQKVSGAGAEYTRNITIEGHTMVGTIHSHANFSAFHSGTDQADESSFDGLHITFGHNQEDPISISASIVANKHRTIVNPEDYMEGVKLVVDIDEEEKVPTTRVFKWDAAQKKMVEDKTKYKTTTYRTYRKFDKRYEIISRSAVKAQVPNSWMQRVEKTSYSYVGWGNYGGWRGNWQGGYWQGGKWHPPAQVNNKWGGNFDSSVWKNRPGAANPPGKLAQGVQDKKQVSAYSPPPGAKTITFPPHDQGPLVTDVTPQRYIPCRACAFKERAMDYVAEEMAEKYGGTIEDLFDQDEENTESYMCEKCNLLVEVEYDENNETEGEVICPSCKSDDHLVLIEDLQDEEEEPTVFNHWDDYGDDTIGKKNTIDCTACKAKFDVSLLVEGPSGGECPNCGVLLNPNQEVNYTRSDDKLKCKSCSSEFTRDLAKNDECPFCREPLIMLIGLDPKEANPPSPAKIIPTEEGSRLSRFMQRFIRRE